MDGITLDLDIWPHVSTEPNTGCWLWMEETSATGEPLLVIGGETRPLQVDGHPDEACTLLLLERDEPPHLAWHHLVRRYLRPTDVVVSIGATRLAALVRCPESVASLASRRVCAAIESRLPGPLRCSLT